MRFNFTNYQMSVKGHGRSNYLFDVFDLIQNCYFARKKKTIVLQMTFIIIRLSEVVKGHLGINLDS